MRQITLCAVIVTLIGCNSARTPRAPEGYVITPHGLVHESCVREVAPGERVHAGGAVLRADGRREQLPPCTKPRLNHRTLEPMSSVTPTVSGWVEAANWTSAAPLGSMTATWTVPAVPATNGATVFFFPGSEPANGSTILQPVLQYGSSAAGGGNYWTMASWFCCPSGWTTHSPLVNVNAGDTLLGTMNAVCASGSCNWTITTTDSTTGATAPLQADAVVSPFVWQFGGVLEAYSLTDCAQYPANSPTVFSNVVLKDQSGNTMAPNWAPLILSVNPLCGYNVASTANSVTLSYQ